MSCKVTSIVLHKTGLGDQMAITYSKVGEDGTILAQNKRAESLIVDRDAEDAAYILYRAAQAYVEGKEEE